MHPHRTPIMSSRYDGPFHRPPSGALAGLPLARPRALPRRAWITTAALAVVAYPPLLWLAIHAARVL